MQRDSGTEICPSLLLPSAITDPSFHSGRCLLFRYLVSRYATIQKRIYCSGPHIDLLSLFLQILPYLPCHPQRLTLRTQDPTEAARTLHQKVAVPHSRETPITHNTLCSPTPSPIPACHGCMDFLLLQIPLEAVPPIALPSMVTATLLTAVMWRTKTNPPTLVLTNCFYFPRTFVDIASSFN